MINQQLMHIWWRLCISPLPFLCPDMCRARIKIEEVNVALSDPRFHPIATGCTAEDPQSITPSRHVATQPAICCICYDMPDDDHAVDVYGEQQKDAVFR